MFNEGPVPSGEVKMSEDIVAELSRRLATKRSLVQDIRVAQAKIEELKAYVKQCLDKMEKVNGELEKFEAAYQSEIQF